jgi:hypothetical protein
MEARERPDRRKDRQAGVMAYGHRSSCGRSPRLADHRGDDTIPTMIIDDKDMTIRAAIDSVGLAFS